MKKYTLINCLCSNMVGLFTALLLLSNSPAAGQADSLKNVLSTLEGRARIPILEELETLVTGSEKVTYLLELTKLQYQSEPEVAFHHAKQAIQISELIRDNHTAGAAYAYLARMYFSPRLNYDSARWAVFKALDVLENLLPEEALGFAYNTAGIIYADQGKLAEGIEFFKKAETTFLEIEDRCWATTIHHNIGKLYKYENQFDLAKQYFLECIDRFRENNCTENYDYLFLNLGGMCEEAGEYMEAIRYFDQGLEMSRRMEHREGIGAGLLMLGKVHRKLEAYDLTHQYFNEAMLIAEEYNISKLKSALNFEWAELFLNQKKYDRAKTYIDEGLSQAIQHKRRGYISTGYELLYTYYAALNDPEGALEYYKKYVNIRDSIENEKVESQIAGLENEKNEARIDLLNKENEIIDLKLNRSQIFSYVVIGISLISLIVVYILFRNYRHQQKIKSMEFRRNADQKILDMERRILDSVIETENRERKRFSADLHDSLGPLLSSAKLYLGELVESTNQEQVELATTTREIIDSAIQNTREISRNMIPDSLNKLGLIEAICTFCHKIERVQPIEFYIKGMEESCNELNPGLEMVLYRVLTELINNTVQHARASRVHIRFTRKDAKLTIRYRDNGIGFNVEKTLQHTHTGMGLQNVKSRIHALHGDIQIISWDRIGTEIIIQLPT